MEMIASRAEIGNRSKKWLFFLPAAAAAALLVLAWYFAANWPFSEEKIVDLLQKHFQKRVLITKFQKTYFPPGFLAEGVQLVDRNRKDLPPLAVLRKVQVAASYSGLIRHHVARVDITGLEIVIPPPGTLHMHRPPDYSRPAVLDLVTVNGGSLTVLAENWATSPSGHPPFQTRIQSIELNAVGQDERIPFHASLLSATPPGVIHTEGKLGPWNSGQPRDTALSGSFRLENADLAYWKDVFGTLTSAGRFTGTLARLRAEGTADVADFHVDRSKHKAQLSAIFTAAVDEESGNVSLENVKAHLGRTTLLSSGDVTGAKGQKGKTVHLEMEVPDGTIEDLLRTATEQGTPAMTGSISLRAKVELPPGPGFLRRVHLTGDFGIDGSRLTNPKRQAVLNHLGESAEGESKSQQNQDPKTVLSTLKGHVAIRDGIATLTRVSFRFEGSEAQVEGTYNLLNHRVALHGVLTTRGKLADSSNGWKAGLLRIATPFLRKHKTTRVNFTITGTSSDPRFNLTLRSKHAS